MKNGTRIPAGMAPAAGLALFILVLFWQLSRADNSPGGALRIVGLEREAGGIRLHTELPPGYTNRVDIFAAPLGGPNPQWQRVAKDLSPAQAASWTTPPNLAAGMIYAFGDADTDSDLDGACDAYEFFVTHTDPATPNADLDLDGIPGWWEELHGFDPLDPSDAGADPDGDGLNSREEFLLGTNPHQSPQWQSHEALGLDWFTVAAH